MTQLDIAILVIYLVGIVGIGVWVSRGVSEDEDLFLAGRSLGWAAIGLSLFASNISSTTMVGLAGAAYMSGIAVSAYEWMAGVVLVLMSFVVIPVYLRSRITTVPEYLSLRFGPGLRRYFSAITVIMSILVDTAGGIYAGSIVLQVFFPSVPIEVTCVALAVFAGLYTAAGGLRAVVYTDVVQAVVLLAGSSILTWIAFTKLGGTWEAVTANLPEGRLSLVRPLDAPDLPWLGLITGVPVLGFWYWATNQYITQRLLAAKDVQNARWGAMLGGALKILPLFVMVLPGVMAIHLFPGLEESDAVLPTMIVKLLPAGLTGLVLAALISAILSSIDSTLNAASALIVHDFMGGDRHASAGRGRIVTVILMVVAAAWAPAIQHAGGLFDYLQQAFAIVAPPVAVVFLLGMLWSKVGRTAALLGMFGGHLMGLGFYLASRAGIWTAHFTVTAGLVAGLVALLMSAVALVRPAAPPPPDTLFSFAQVAPAPPVAWFRDYRVHAAAIIAGIGGVVIGFW